MIYAGRLLVCAALSAGAHAVLAGVDPAPRAPTPRAASVEVRIVEPPPPPPEPEPPPPEPEPPPPEVQEAPPPKPRPRPVRAAASSERPPSERPPTERPVDAPSDSAAPVFGVSMESTSQAGATSAPVGNTLQTAPGKAPAAEAKPLGPVAAHEVTKMPMPRGSCSGNYTEAARAAGIEGTVVLDLVVAADGSTTDVKIASGLSHGLDEAAVAALRRCRFTPGERDGAPVAVRVRGFKVHFYLQGSE